MEPVPNRAPKLNTEGSLDDLLASYGAVKAAGRAKYQARKNDTRLPGEKKHSHDFANGDEVNVDPNPYGRTAIECAVDGCGALLHDSSDIDEAGNYVSGLEVEHNGKRTPWKRK